ncbi:MAG: ribosome assembly RNA-binding protein YhbY [Candidatus Ozemobacteraceae bacterium]
MVISSKQRKFLESFAHDLEPVVRIGKFGVTPTLIQTVHQNLTAQELVKIKILENAEIEREEAAEILVEKTKATLIQIIGRVIILYRANPEGKNRVEFPGMETSKVTTDEKPKKAATRRPRTAPPSHGKKPSPGKKAKGRPAPKTRKTAGTAAGKRITRRSKR